MNSRKCNICGLETFGLVGKEPVCFICYNWMREAEVRGYAPSMKVLTRMFYRSNLKSNPVGEQNEVTDFF